MTPEEANNLNRERALDNGNALAFPNDNGTPFHLGMTKREYMATKLMAAAISNGHNSRDAASIAVNGVDILLIELKKTNG